MGIIKDMKDVIVSVSVCTYNHVDYIENCLDGILAQKTSFPFKIIIGEDESNDGTREICKDYAKRHQDIIELHLRQRKNVIYTNGNPTGRYNFIKNLESCTGKYIALCDGDDHWIDPNKLQKQVDFLEANSEISMCFTNGISVDHNNVKIDNIMPEYFHPRKFDTKYLISRDCRIPTASVVFLRNLLDFDLTQFPMGDYPMYYFLSKKGLIGYLSESSVAYRIHQSSFLRSNSIKELKRNQILCIQKILERDKSELKTLSYNMSVHYDELAGLEFRDKNYIQFFKILSKTLAIYPFRNLRQWRDTIYRLRKYE